MPVLKLVLAYDGTNFRGWTRQPGKRTVQGVLERALERMLGEVPRLSVAGRTDAGVHARGQVVSLRAEDPERLQRGLNGMLAPEVVVRRATRAPDGFDARRRARARIYRYRVSLAPVPDPFSARFVWHRPGPVAVAPMRRAARLLEGEHDFASFCRAPRRGGTVRRLERVTIRREGDLLAFGLRGSAFCHQMVRSLVGTLLEVGEGKREAGGMTELLEARSRRGAGHMAPPHGLTLEQVLYRS